MANCVVTFAVNSAALSGRVQYEPLPNQIIDGVAIDTTKITATAASTAYTATLIREARYRLVSEYFRYENEIFTVPDSATANLSDLLGGYRAS